MVPQSSRPDYPMSFHIQPRFYLRTVRLTHPLGARIQQRTKPLTNTDLKIKNTKLNPA